MRLLLTPDLSEQASRTGYLEVQLLNDGELPVYFDSLTVRHPQEELLVSQENHYYPFGLALSGVAVNTSAAVQSSKKLYNGGSKLQDELLGDQGIYSTFYRNYDPTVGRFWGVDPLADRYASWTPYQFAFNSPVIFNDPTGAETWSEFLNRIMHHFDQTEQGHYEMGPSGVIQTSEIMKKMNNGGITNLAVPVCMTMVETQKTVDV